MEIIPSHLRAGCAFRVGMEVLTSRRDPHTARREVEELQHRKSPSVKRGTRPPEKLDLAPRPLYRAPRGARNQKKETRFLEQSEPLDQVLSPSLLRKLEETP